MLPQCRTTTFGANGETLKAGDTVICINAIIGGDNDTLAEWDFTQGKEYTIVSVFDDDNLIDPMVVIKGSRNGPTLASRFVHAKERVALDAGYNILKAGDRVLCTTDNESGDTGSEFDLKAGQKYIVDAVHDEDHLSAPMVLIKDSTSGPVFPERFKKILTVR